MLINVLVSYVLSKLYSCNKLGKIALFIMVIVLMILFVLYILHFQYQKLEILCQSNVVTVTHIYMYTVN